MRLHRLDITAFGPFGAAQRVDFDELSAAGLFLLHGPTGAGKTSVLDAVCYALYGAVPGARQSGQGLGLRSDHATPDVRTEIRLELSVAGRRLEVTRQPPWERPKKRGTGTTTEKAQSWLREYDSVAGSWKGLSRSHQEIGEEITQLLGMSREQFCQVVLLPQGDFARFLRADAEARGKLLGRLFDTHRFAEVEKRLAERRRAAEAEVRAGDTALLADAHRMQQAAGHIVEEPLPDLAPGDPGLAGSVLAWAAVARSTAREVLTVADCARGAAESAQAAADRTLDDVREVDRLQRRFTEAQERAARLEQRADAHGNARTRMERAHKAETVAPALELRDAAEAEHRRAATEETRTRAALPETYAGAGAPGLAAAARKAAEELGGLESARRAERRLGELGTERASLDRQERADEDVLQDAESWLADWEETREGVEARVDTAQEAAARAEQLVGQREPAFKRLAAARLRDELAQDTETAHARSLAAREQATEAHAHWLDLKEQRLQGIAAELAAGLVDGESCAVCGATEHPAPARKIAYHVDRETEERALAAYRGADEKRVEAERWLGVVREALAAATAEAGDASTRQLEEQAEELERLHSEARTVASGLHAAREAREQAEREHERRLTAQQEAARRVAARASHRDSLDREKASLEGELEQARGTAVSVSARATQLERQVALLTEAAEGVRAAEDIARRLKDADARLADAAFRAGFETPQAAAAAMLDDVAHRDLQRQLDAWQLEESSVRAVLAEADTAAAARRPPVDLRAAERAAESASRRLRDTALARDAAARRCTELNALSTRATGGAGSPAARGVRTRGPPRRSGGRHLGGQRTQDAAGGVRPRRPSGAGRRRRHGPPPADVLGALHPGALRRPGGPWTQRARTACRGRLDRTGARHGDAVRRRDLLRLPRPGARPRRRGHRRGRRGAAGHALHRRGLRKPRRPDPRRGARRPRLAAGTRSQRRHRQPRRRPAPPHPRSAGGREGENGVGGTAAGRVIVAGKGPGRDCPGRRRERAVPALAVAVSVTQRAARQR